MQLSNATDGLSVHFTSCIYYIFHPTFSLAQATALQRCCSDAMASRNKTRRPACERFLSGKVQGGGLFFLEVEQKYGFGNWKKGVFRVFRRKNLMAEFQ